MKRALLWLPSGFILIVEVATTPADMRRGLAGRMRLLKYQGMLFVSPHVGLARFTMQGMLLPLDMIWLGPDRRIVEIYENAQPGDVGPFGGNVPSKYTLEVPAGMAERYGLRVGQGIRWLEGSRWV